MIQVCQAIHCFGEMSTSEYSPTTKFYQVYWIHFSLLKSLRNRIWSLVSPIQS